MLNKASLAQACRLIQNAQSLCVLTGAGISAESGLKTFRDAGGLWEDHPVEKVATPEGFAADPELVWRFYNARRRHADVATPNAGHIALARLELGRKRQAKKRPRESSGNGNSVRSHANASFTLLTQNIDGLHQQAGSQNVVELHGSIWKIRCTGCSVVSDDHPIELPALPCCLACGGLLRPHVVWFGETLDPDVLAQAEEAATRCDLFLVIGTSAVVQPAAAYPFIAARRHIPIIEVNLENTPVSEIAILTLLGKAGEILPKLIP